MGIMDAFNAEDRITVTVSKFGEMMKAAVKADLMMNAVNCEVPYQYIREMVTGIKEEKKRPMDKLIDSMDRVIQSMGDVLDNFIEETEEEDDESVCGDDDTEEGDGSEGPEGGSGPEDGCDEADGAEGAGLED